MTSTKEMKKTRLINLLLVVSIIATISMSTLFGATANADSMEIRLGGSESAVTDEGYDFLSEDNFLSVGQLSIQIPLLTDHLWIGVEYNWGIESFDPFGDVSNNLDIDGLSATARLQHQLTSFMTPYLGTGVGFSHLDLSSVLAGQVREQDAFIGVFTFLGGVDLHMPTALMRKMFNISRRSWAKDLTFGIILEGGYQLATSADFDALTEPEPDREPKPEDKPIEAASVGFGAIDLSGVIMRSALVIRF